jgi:hypothetical protein
MTSPMKYFRKDPMRKGRGAGFYYMRSHNGRRWFSKYTASKDAHRRSTGHSMKVSGRYEHTADRHIGKRIRHSLKITPKSKMKRVFGWF